MVTARETSLVCSGYCGYCRSLHDDAELPFIVTNSQSERIAVAQNTNNGMVIVGGSAAPCRILHHYYRTDSQTCLCNAVIPLSNQSRVQRPYKETMVR